MLGFSVGPLVGGALTHLASWRLIFCLNVVLARDGSSAWV